jgi:hypothetical protein
LAPTGAVRDVAHLPYQGGQQEISFAANPNGSVVEVAILTLPPVAASPPANPPDPFWASGDFSMSIYQVQPGQQPIEIQHDTWPQSHVTTGPSYQAVGWDNGIIYTMPTELGTQQPYNGYKWFGPAVHYSAFSGGPGATLGGPDCHPLAASGAGIVACMDQFSRNPSLRKLDGSVQFAFPNANENYSYFAFSPSGSRLAYFKFMQATPAKGEVIDVTGQLVARLNLDFRPRAWLDEGTLLGDDTASPGGRRLAYVRLSEAMRIHDLPVTGAFSVVGAITGG